MNKLEQIVDGLLEQIMIFKMELIPDIDATSEQCMMVLSIICVLAALFIGSVLIRGIHYFYMQWKRRIVQRYFSLPDLSRFNVEKMSKKRTNCYSDDNVNTYQLILPRWKYENEDGSRRQNKLFNRIIWGNSVLFLQIRDNVYVLRTHDPWDMTYIVHLLRESEVYIAPCQLEIEKEERIRQEKLSTEEYIQKLIEEMNGEEAAFIELCRRKLMEHGYCVADAPKNSYGMHLFVLKDQKPSLVKCHYVSPKYISGLKELKEIHEFSNNLLTDSCILITTGHITVAGASYAKEHRIDVICTDLLVKFMEEDELGSVNKAYELNERDLRENIPADLLKRIFK